MSPATYVFLEKIEKYYVNMSVKQCRTQSDVTSGFTLFAQACLSQYLGLLWRLIMQPVSTGLTHIC